MIKRASGGTGGWFIFDAIRGIVTGGNDSTLQAESSGAEGTGDNRIFLTATGFQIETTSSFFNNSGDTYIYMAIRRGPLAEPESATDVFGVSAYTSDGTNGRVISSSPSVVDLILNLNRDGGNYSVFYDRLRGSKKELSGISTGAEETATNEGVTLDTNKGTIVNSAGYYDWPNHGSEDQVVYSWKRAPSYFDVTTWSGTQVARTIPHNLGLHGAVPEMIWVKNRDGTTPWMVYHSALGNQAYLQLNSTAAAVTGNTSRWNATTPTASVFSLGDSGSVNGSGSNYIAYLFSTVPNVSCVGSYTGNGSTQTIDCGFSGSGARFVMLKRTNLIGSFVVFDAARGITTSTDPLLYLDTTGAERADLSTYDINPHSSGFTLMGGGSYTNSSGSSYIFYAIA